MAARLSSARQLGIPWIKWLLVMLFAARLSMALVAYAYPDRPILVDSEGYLRLAESLRTSGRFQATPYLETVRTPGYPAFLAFLQAVIGERVGHIVLFQLALTGLTAWLIYLCGSRLADQGAGLAAVWIYALNPNSLFWAFTLLTETLFAFGLILTLYLFLRQFDHDDQRWLAFSGIALGVSTLVRPIGIYLILLWTLAAAVLLPRRWGFRRALSGAAVFFILAILPALAWMTRNQIRHGAFTLSTTTEVTITRFIAVNTLSDALQIGREEAKLIILQQPDPVSYSFQVVREYPISFLRATVQGVARTLLATEVGTWLNVFFDLPYEGSGLLNAVLRGDLEAIAQAASFRLRAIDSLVPLSLMIWGVAYSVFLYFAIGYGGWTRFGQLDVDNRWIVLFLVLSIAYLLLIPLANGDARFRVPAAPQMAILAGLPWAKIRDIR